MTAERPGTNLVETLGSGIFAWKGSPRYGRQDFGYSPGGAQDRFAFRTANILLGNDPDAPALEIITPPRVVRFLADCAFVFTGGRRDATLREAPESTAGHPLEHATVYTAAAGNELRFGRRVYGFRTYLACRDASAGSIGSITRARGTFEMTDHIVDANKSITRARGTFTAIAGWPDPAGFIRVVVGPEYPFLLDPDAFFTCRWTVEEMNDMGARLRAPQMPPVRDEQLISAPVCDGTVQMTPGGPIVLMRGRQTTGGYPRVVNVINPDLDLLAQFAPGQGFCFRSIALEEALMVQSRWHADLEKLKARFLSN